MATSFGHMQQGLEALNAVLAKLGEEQVIIQQEPRKRWSLFGRGNGG